VAPTFPFPPANPNPRPHVYNRRPRFTSAATVGVSALALVCGRLTLAAAGPASPTATAEALFQEGRALMIAGHAREACQKFGESNRLDPATGTLLNLAVCNETVGKTATAWSQFRAAEVASVADHRDDRVSLAREHLASLLPKLSVITVQVSDAQRIPGLKLSLDGVVWGEPLWNVPTPIDPGEHTVVAEGPGRVSRSYQAKVGARAQKLLIVVDLAPASDVLASPVVRSPSPPRAAPVPETEPPRVVVRMPGPEPAPGSSRSPSAGAGAGLAGSGGAGSTAGAAGTEPASSLDLTLAYVSGGIGVAALIAGTIFGAEAFSRWGDRKTDCPMDVCSTDAGKQAQIGAENAARNADVAVVIGLVALGAGGYLYYRGSSGDKGEAEGPRRVSFAPSFAPSRAGVVMESSW
jgi:hypothetical protein